MKLFVDSQFTSPYAMSVFVALHEKRLLFDIQPLDLAAGDARAPDYAELSLTHRVPTLVDGDFALSESSAITEYIDETYAGQALYPKDRKQRARARQVQAWLRTDLLPIRAERSTLLMFYGLEPDPLSEEAKEAALKLFSGAESLLTEGGRYICGDAWCIADVDLALMLNRLVLNGDNVPVGLINYAEHQWQRPSVQQWVELSRPPLNQC